jgi:hypothetical protein
MAARRLLQCVIGITSQSVIAPYFARTKTCRAVSARSQETTMTDSLFRATAAALFAAGMILLIAAGAFHRVNQPKKTGDTLVATLLVPNALAI